MSVFNASGASVNASYYRNGTGSVTLGLDSHLDPNAIHWDCVIKHDSDCKKHENDNFK